MHEEHRRWFTPNLQREFDMLVFGTGGYPVILFPTSQGSYHQNKDFGLVESAAHLVDAGLVKIYTPDSNDKFSWYNYDIHPSERVNNHLSYENLILNEVIEMAKKETGFSTVAVAGASFGGYHCLNVAFRHPEKVGNLISLCGAFDIKQFIFGYYDDNCYYNNPPDYMPNLNDEWYLRKLKEMNIILSTGETDNCREDNVKMSTVLNDKGINHWLDDRQGFGHDWNWWRELFPQYLVTINEVKNKL